jgi:putative heme-binding domain-containing protein
MDRIRATLAAALAGLCVVAAAAQQPAPQPAGPKPTADEIFEYQNKQDAAGSPEAGRPIYDKQCAICHRFGAIGSDVGPDLTTIASRFKKKDLLESILWPSKIVSDQYQSEMFELKDGTVITGVIVRETAINAMVRTAENPEKPVQVPKARIAHRATSPVSLMPEGLLEGYTQKEIADLLAFVLSPPPAK